MHQDFPKLFAEISVDNAERENRWAGVEAFVGTYTAPRVEVLVRLAFGTKPPAVGFQQPDLELALAAFHKAFSDIDMNYAPAARQDQILAAAVLLQFFGSNSLAALATTTTGCGGSRKATLPIDLINEAENALSRLAASRRGRPDLSKIEIEEQDFEFEPDFTEAQPNSPQTFKGVFDQFKTALDEALADLTGKINESIKTLVDANKKADEELDMLSWVFGGRALLPDETFVNVPSAQMPLVFARDLASLTTIYPGPNSVPALLSRAGVKGTGKLSVVEAVDAVTDDWTAAVLKGRTPSPASSPIHLALAKRQETGSGGGWQTGWAATTGIDAAAAMPAIELAEMFYREILWVR